MIVRSDDESVTSLTVYPAIMDYAQYDKAMKLLEGGNMEVTEYEDTKIIGHINVEKEGQMLFTTIPYDEGWTVYVDGEKVDYRDFKHSFLALDLEPGEHTIEFRYWPIGLTPGIIVSLIAIAGFVVWMLIRKKMLVKSAGFEYINKVAK